jgi:hypothetical protein
LGYHHFLVWCCSCAVQCDVLGAFGEHNWPLSCLRSIKVNVQYIILKQITFSWWHSLQTVFIMWYWVLQSMGHCQSLCRYWCPLYSIKSNVNMELTGIYTAAWVTSLDAT